MGAVANMWKQYYRFATFGSATVYALVAVYAVATGNYGALGIVALLAVLEVSLSFDNAIANARYVVRLNQQWQERFLTWGIFIAVFGMRLLFPVLVVSATAGANPLEVTKIAITDPKAYAVGFEHAHVPLVVFGGIYLLQIFINYMANKAEKEATWLPIERVFEFAGSKVNPRLLAFFAAVLAVVCLANFQWPDHKVTVYLWGAGSIALFQLVAWIGDKLGGDEDDDEEDKGDEAEAGTATGSKSNQLLNLSGRAAAMVFLYLELQDAMFSFDGIMGAFAFTLLVVLILAGNGIGALFVRSMTIQLVRTNSLAEFPFLGGGAYFAIGILPFAMWFELPDFLIGGVTVLLIAAAVVHSVYYKKHHPEAEEEVVDAFGDIVEVDTQQ